MRNKTHYQKLLDQNPSADIGFALAAAAIYAAKHGECEAVDRSSSEYKAIARRLKAEFGETLTIAEVTAEMDK